MKVLILNSDLSKNRGDRAIAEGLIELIRAQFDDVTITGLSETADRDAAWFGIRFLPMDANSVNPLQWLRLAWHVSRSDLVLWGGGEILKDYTNKLALWYWAVKITWLRLFNRRIVGAFQGIGPTYGRSSRRLVAYCVNRCRRFALRDAESVTKLIDWGVDSEKLIASSDPAVCVSQSAQPDDSGLSDEIRNDFIAIAPRNWFHYQPGGILPHRMRSAEAGNTADNLLYRQRIGELIQLAGEYARHVVLVPMHMREDVDFCKALAASVDSNLSVTVLAEDTVAPSALRQLLSQARAMIGFRLHATIIATSVNVPSLNVYYVDKGRLYFEQIDQSRFAFGIETLLDDERFDAVKRAFGELLAASADVRASLTPRTQALQEDLTAAFERLCVDD